MEGNNSLNEKAKTFSAQPGDVCIVAYPRSGTTWLQMILYQLFTGGEMNFAHISQFVPFLERTSLHDRALQARMPRRLFKTHRRLTSVKGTQGKYIYLIRNGRDVLTSYYHFYKNYLEFNASLTDFVDRFVSGKVRFGSWFHHVADSRLYENNVFVHYVKYEDLLLDFEGQVHRIASFLRVTLSTNKLNQLRERCSFEFMRQNESKFDYATEALLMAAQDLRAGTFLRQGETGAWTQYLTRSQEELFEKALNASQSKHPQ